MRRLWLRRQKEQLRGQSDPDISPVSTGITRAFLFGNYFLSVYLVGLQVTQRASKVD